MHDNPTRSSAQPGSRAERGGRIDTTADTFHVLFWPDDAMPCKYGKHCHRKGCSFSHARTSLVQLLEILHASKTCMDICVFNITCNEIAAAIIDAHKRGVKVRIVTDKDQESNQGSDIDQLRRLHIPVRLNRTDGLMHHKFCIVDGRLALTGSFNWTRAAVLQNNENLLVTSAAEVRTEYQHEFDRLWREFA